MYQYCAYAVDLYYSIIIITTSIIVIIGSQCLKVIERHMVIMWDRSSRVYLSAARKAALEGLGLGGESLRGCAPSRCHLLTSSRFHIAALSTVGSDGKILATGCVLVNHDICPLGLLDTRFAKGITDSCTTCGSYQRVVNAHREELMAEPA